MPTYRVHYAHPDGIDTTGPYETDRELTVGDVFEADGLQWEVHDVERFDLEGYAGYVAVRPHATDA